MLKHGWRVRADPRPVDNPASLKINPLSPEVKNCPWKRVKSNHTLVTLHHQVMAVEALWDDITKNTKQTFGLAVAHERRPWFEGLWANAGESVKLTPMPSNS